jgi:hypothetical protein
VGVPGTEDKLNSALAELNDWVIEEQVDSIFLTDTLAHYESTLTFFRDHLDEVESAGQDAESMPSRQSLGPLSTPLTDAEYFSDVVCPFGERHDDLTIFLSEQLLFVAEGVREAASRSCNQVAVVVVLGEGGGGNASLACIASDALFILAKETHNVLTFCDKTVDEAEIEGAFERADDIHANLNEHHDLVEPQIQAIATDLDQHDADIKSQIDTHDVDVKALLANVQDGVDQNGEKLDVALENLLEVIRLLHVPHGLRDSEVAACDGGPCDFPEFN